MARHRHRSVYTPPCLPEKSCDGFPTNRTLRNRVKIDKLTRAKAEREAMIAEYKKNHGPLGNEAEK
ncbi:MAG: hypothetical protein MIO92_14210 [Methanosarcinaceae archaeon]|nr:hypothetical protein [Methanosarcinaceae archaeon]